MKKLGYILIIGTWATLSAAPTKSNYPSNIVSQDYVLQPADAVRVQIFQEPDLEREVSITQENTLNLPLIGSVDLRDKTVRQAENLIQELYSKDYLVNPQVTVTVLKYAEKTVQVIGAVNRPGAVLFPAEDNMTIVEAIGRAGGQARIANLKKVQLKHAGANESTEVNVEDIMRGEKPDIALQKGDVVNVPERIL